MSSAASDNAALRVAAAASSDGAIITQDLTGTITSWNRAAEQIFGHSTTEAVGQSIRLIVPPELHGENDDIQRRINAGESLDHYDTVRIRKDGRQIDVMLTVSPLATAGGEIVGASQISRVITERKRLEREARYRAAIVQSRDDAIISKDLTGTITSWNRAAERLFGYTAATVIGQSIRLVIPADRQAEEDRLLDIVRRGEIVDHIETIRSRKDGSLVPVSLSVSPIRSGNGTIVGISKIAREFPVTRRLEALLTTGALPRAIFNSATLSSIATDADGVIQIFNVGAERMLGYAAAEVMNRITPADISDPQEVIARAKALSVELATPIAPGFEALVFKASRGIEDIYELTYIRKDGSRWPAVVSVAALRDARDVIIGYLLISMDNTARKEAGEQLRLQSAALDAAANAIVITDRSGLIQWVNPAFSELTGYAAEEAVGRNSRELVKSGQHDRAFYKNLWDSILSGRVWRGEIVNRRKDNSLYTEEQTITPVRDSRGELSHFIAVKQDITERKRAEEAFRKGEEQLRQAEILSRSLVEHVPQRMLVKDLNSNYVFCNSVYARDLGIEPTQIVGKDDFAFFSRELAEGYRADDRQVMTEGNIRTLDERYTVAGVEHWIHTVKVPYRDERGEIIGVLALLENISERKRVELQHERLVALVEASPDFIGYADPKTTQIKYINKGGRRMCGIGEDEDVGRLTLGDLHPAWMDRRLADVVLPAAERNGLWEGEGAFLHRGGHEIPVSMVFLAHRGADGEVDFFHTVSRDITQRNQAVEALRKAEERTRFALQAANVGIWDLDVLTGAARWSETLEAQFGLPPGTFAGTFEAFVELVHPADRKALRETVANAMKTGADFSILHRSIWPDGTVRWLSGAGRILLGLHGEPVRGLGIYQDVTGRKQADETRARLAAIVDSTDDAIVSTALDDTILTWNQGAERLYGYTANDMIGRSRALVVPAGASAELTAAMWDKAARGEGGEPFETQCVRKDGSTIDISLTISPMTDSTGRVTGASTIARDIRIRKKAEAELQRLNDEIQLQRMRVFKATIRTVQDIVNNLLNGFQIVRLEGEGHLPAELLTLVDRIVQEAGVKLQMLGDLETVSEKEMAIGTGIDYPGGGF
ncbi:MAG: PAS domain S-box protein [Acidobacteriota bacterium]